MHFRSIQRVNKGLGYVLNHINPSSDLDHSRGHGRVYNTRPQSLWDGPTTRHEVLQLLVDTRKEDKKSSKYDQAPHDIVRELQKIIFAQSQKIAKLSSRVEDLEQVAPVISKKRKSPFAGNTGHMNSRRQMDQHDHESSSSEESFEAKKTVVKRSKKYKRRHRRRMMKRAIRLRKEYKARKSASIQSSEACQASLQHVLSSSDGRLKAEHALQKSPNQRCLASVAEIC